MKTYALSSKFAAPFVLTLMLGLASSAAQAACGQFEVAKGDVKVTSFLSKATAAVVVGGKICSGDTVIAGKDSRAKIKMEDGNELNISPESKIILENYQYEPATNKKKVLLNILQGKVRAATQKENMYNDKSADGSENSFQVKTKSAVAGVRGTDFLTSYDPKTKASAVVTFRGTVAFGQPGPGGSILNAVAVKAGQTTSMSLGTVPLPPKVVPPAQLNQMNSESNSAPASSANAPANGKPAAANSSSGSAAAGSSTGSATGSTTASTTAGTADGRAPSSTGPSVTPSVAPSTSPSVMLGANDLGGGSATADPSTTVKPSNLPVIPAAPAPPTLTLPSQVQQAIQASTKTKVNVTITLPK